MGAFESVDIGLDVLGFLLVFGGIVVLITAIMHSTFASSLMFSSSVRAGLIAGCISASGLHSNMEVTIQWNLLPVTFGVSNNLMIAALDKIGWVAFPGMILESPQFSGLREGQETPVFESETSEGWIAKGNAIEKIYIFHNESGRGVIIN